MIASIGIWIVGSATTTGTLIVVVIAASVATVVSVFVNPDNGTDGTLHGPGAGSVKKIPPFFIFFKDLKILYY
jgi:hypothetical protein